MRRAPSSNKASKADREIPPNAKRADLLPDEQVARGAEAEQSEAIRAAAAQTKPIVTDDTPGATEGIDEPEIAQLASKLADDIAEMSNQTRPIWGSVDLKAPICFECPYDTLGLSNDMGQGAPKLQERFSNVSFLFNWYKRTVWFSGTPDLCEEVLQAFPNAKFEAV